MSLWDILVPAEPGVVHNTIANPSFEYNNSGNYTQVESFVNDNNNGIKYWSNYGNTTISRSNTWASQGSFSLKIPVGTPQNAGVQYNPRLGITDSSLTTVVLAKASGGSLVTNKYYAIAVMGLDDVGMSLANNISDMQSQRITVNNSQLSSSPTIDAKRGHTDMVFSTILLDLQLTRITVSITSSAATQVMPRGYAIWCSVQDSDTTDGTYSLVAVVPNSQFSVSNTSTIVSITKVITPQSITAVSNATLTKNSYLSNRLYVSKISGGVATITATNNTTIVTTSTNAFTAEDIGKVIYVASRTRTVGVSFTISTDVSSNLVSGTIGGGGSGFVTTDVGRTLFDVSGNFIGVIFSVTSATSAILADNAGVTLNGGSAYWGSDIGVIASVAPTQITLESNTTLAVSNVTFWKSAISTKVNYSIYIQRNNQYLFLGKMSQFRTETSEIELYDSIISANNIVNESFFIANETNPMAFPENIVGGISSFQRSGATYTPSYINLNATAPYWGVTNSSFGNFTKSHHLYLDWYLSSNSSNPNATYTNTGANWSVYLVNNASASATLLGTLDKSTVTSDAAKRMGLRTRFLVNRPSGNTADMSIRIVYTGSGTSDADLYIDAVQFVDAGMIWRAYDWYNTTASTYNTPMHFDDWDWDNVEFSYIDGDVPGAIWADTMPTQSGTYQASFPYFTNNGIWHANPNEYGNIESASGYNSSRFRKQIQWRNEAKPVFGVSIPGLSQSSLLTQSTSVGFWASLTNKNINVVVEPNTTGVGMPEIATTALEYGIVDGGFVQRQIARMRNMQFTITISAQSWASLHSNRRSLINLLKFDQLAQQGDRMLRYTGADTPIVTSVTYQDGLGFNGTAQNASFTELLQLRFLSSDPYFYAQSKLSQAIDIESTNTNDISVIHYKIGNNTEWLPLSKHYVEGTNIKGDTYFYNQDKSITNAVSDLGWIISPSGNTTALVVGGDFEYPFSKIAFFFVSGFEQKNTNTIPQNVLYNLSGTVSNSGSTLSNTANAFGVLQQGDIIITASGAEYIGTVASIQSGTQLTLTQTPVRVGTTATTFSNVRAKFIRMADKNLTDVKGTVFAKQGFSLDGKIERLYQDSANTVIAVGSFSKIIETGTISTTLTNASVTAPTYRDVNTRIVRFQLADTGRIIAESVDYIGQEYALGTSPSTINSNLYNLLQYFNTQSNNPTLVNATVFDAVEGPSNSYILATQSNIISNTQYDAFFPYQLTRGSSSFAQEGTNSSIVQMNSTKNAYFMGIRLTGLASGFITYNPTNISDNLKITGSGTNFDNSWAGKSLFNVFGVYIGQVYFVASSNVLYLYEAPSFVFININFEVSGDAKAVITDKNTQRSIVYALLSDDAFNSVGWNTYVWAFINSVNPVAQLSAIKGSRSVVANNLNSVLGVDNSGTISINSNSNNVSGNNTNFNSTMIGNSIIAITITNNVTTTYFVGQISSVTDKLNLSLSDYYPSTSLSNASFVIRPVKYFTNSLGYQSVGGLIVSANNAIATTNFNSDVTIGTNITNNIGRSKNNAIAIVLGGTSVNYSYALTQLSSGFYPFAFTDSTNKKIFFMTERVYSNYLARRSVSRLYNKITTSPGSFLTIPEVPANKGYTTIVDGAIDAVPYQGAGTVSQPGISYQTTSVTFSGSTFSAQDVGRTLYTTGNAFVGVIVAVTSATQITITSAQSIINGGGNYKLSGIAWMIGNGVIESTTSNNVTVRFINDSSSLLVGKKIMNIATGEDYGIITSISADAATQSITLTVNATLTVQSNLNIPYALSVPLYMYNFALQNMNFMPSYLKTQFSSQNIGMETSTTIDLVFNGRSGTVNTAVAIGGTTVTFSGATFVAYDVNRLIYNNAQQLVGTIVAVATGGASITITAAQSTMAASSNYYLSPIDIPIASASGANNYYAPNFTAYTPGPGTVTTTSNSRVLPGVNTNFSQKDIGKNIYTTNGFFVGTIASVSTSPTANNPTAVILDNLPRASISSSSYSMGLPYALYAYVNYMWKFVADVAEITNTSIKVSSPVLFPIPSGTALSLIPYSAIETSAVNYTSTTTIANHINYVTNEELYTEYVSSNTAAAGYYGTINNIRNLFYPVYANDHTLPTFYTNANNTLTVTGTNPIMYAGDVLFTNTGNFLGVVKTTSATATVTLTANTTQTISSGSPASILRLANPGKTTISIYPYALTSDIEPTSWQNMVNSAHATKAKINSLTYSIAKTVTGSQTSNYFADGIGYITSMSNPSADLYHTSTLNNTPDVDVPHVAKSIYMPNLIVKVLEPANVQPNGQFSSGQQPTPTATVINFSGTSFSQTDIGRKLYIITNSGDSLIGTITGWTSITQITVDKVAATITQNAYFKLSAILSSSSLSILQIAAQSESQIAYDSIGSCTSSTSSPTITGSSTNFTNFATNNSSLVGRPIYASVSSNFVLIGVVKRVVNNTQITLEANALFTVTAANTPFYALKVPLKYAIFPGDILRTSANKILGMVRRINLFERTIELTENATETISSYASNSGIRVQRGKTWGRGTGLIYKIEVQNSRTLATANPFSVNNIITVVANTAIVSGTGTISTHIDTNIVIGVATVFTQFDVGKKIYTSANAYIGTISKVLSNTHILLLGNAQQTISAAAYKLSVYEVGRALFNDIGQYIGTVVDFGASTLILKESAPQISINSAMNLYDRIKISTSNLPTSGASTTLCALFTNTAFSNFPTVYGNEMLTSIVVQYPDSLPGQSRTNVGYVNALSYLQIGTNDAFPVGNNTELYIYRADSNIRLLDNTAGSPWLYNNEYTKNYPYSSASTNSYQLLPDDGFNISNALKVNGIGVITTSTTSNIVTISNGIFTQTVPFVLYDTTLVNDNSNIIGTVVKLTDNTTAVLSSNATKNLLLQPFLYSTNNLLASLPVIPGAGYISFIGDANGISNRSLADTSTGNYSRNLFSLVSNSTPSNVRVSSFFAGYRFSLGASTLTATLGQTTATLSSGIWSTSDIGKGIYTYIAASNNFRLLGIITAIPTPPTASVTITPAAYTISSASSYYLSDVDGLAGNVALGARIIQPYQGGGTISGFGSPNTIVNFAGAASFSSADIGKALYDSSSAFIGVILSVTTTTSIIISPPASTTTGNYFLSLRSVVPDINKNMYRADTYAFVGTMTGLNTLSVAGSNTQYFLAQEPTQFTHQVQPEDMIIIYGDTSSGSQNLYTTDSIMMVGIVTKVIDDFNINMKTLYTSSSSSSSFRNGSYSYVIVPTASETITFSSGSVSYTNGDWQSLGRQNNKVSTLVSLKNGDILAGGEFTGWSDKTAIYNISSNTVSSSRDVYRIAKITANVSGTNQLTESYATPIAGTSYIANGVVGKVNAIVDASDVNPINGYVGSADRVLIGGGFSKTMNNEILLPSIAAIEGSTLTSAMRPIVSIDFENSNLTSGSYANVLRIATSNRLRQYYSNPNTNILDGINGSNIALLFDNSIFANTKMQYTAIRVRGNASVYPVITIKNVTNTNKMIMSLHQTETGAKIMFTNSFFTVYSNETIVIDLRIGKRSITSDIRGNIISYIHPLSNFVDWILIGANSAAGVSTQSTDDYHNNVIGVHAEYGISISFAYTPRFWSFDANNLFFGSPKAGI